MKSLECGYNDRLFSGGLRGRYHMARFHWIAHELAKLRCPSDSVLELGCFDGKLLEYLPSTPKRYVGYDANWEGGLQMAMSKWQGNPALQFREAQVPEDMALDAGERFGLAVSMETFEHIPPALVDGYLAKIARHLDGYFLVTVPNEKGLAFLLKWGMKKLSGHDEYHYSTGEAINAVLGRMTQIERNEHKGFDYGWLLSLIGKHFDVVSVSGHPFGLLPHQLCFGIGIVARSKRQGGGGPRP